jgi:hypothetical protein
MKRGGDMSGGERNGSLTLVSSGIGDSDEDVRKLCRAMSEICRRLHDGREKELRPGMLVQWKPNLKNRKSPEYGKPGIVVEVLNPPIIDTTFDSGSTYFREQLGMIIGFIDEDGDFMTYHADARRFEAYAGSEIHA